MIRESETGSLQAISKIFFSQSSLKKTASSTRLRLILDTKDPRWGKTSTNFSSDNFTIASLTGVLLTSKASLSSISLILSPGFRFSFF